MKIWYVPNNGQLWVRIGVALAAFFLTALVVGTGLVVFFETSGADSMNYAVQITLVVLVTAAVVFAFVFLLSGLWIKVKDGADEVGEAQVAPAAESMTTPGGPMDPKTFRSIVAGFGGTIVLGLVNLGIFLFLGKSEAGTIVFQTEGVLLVVVLAIVLYRWSPRFRSMVAGAVSGLRKWATYLGWLGFTAYLGKLALFAIVGGWWDADSAGGSIIGWVVLVTATAVPFMALFAVAEERRERIVWLTVLAYFGGIVLPNVIVNTAGDESLAWPAFAAVVSALTILERTTKVEAGDWFFASVAAVAAFGLTWLLGLVQPFGWRNQLGAMAVAVVLVQLVYGLAFRGELSLE